MKAELELTSELSPEGIEDWLTRKYVVLRDGMPTEVSFNQATGEELLAIAAHIKKAGQTVKKEKKIGLGKSLMKIALDLKKQTERNFPQVKPAPRIVPLGCKNTHFSGTSSMELRTVAKEKLSDIVGGQRYKDTFKGSNSVAHFVTISEHVNFKGEVEGELLPHEWDVHKQWLIDCFRDCADHFTANYFHRWDGPNGEIELWSFSPMEWKSNPVWEEEQLEALEKLKTENDPQKIAELKWKAPKAQ